MFSLQDLISKLNGSGMINKTEVPTDWGKTTVSGLGDAKSEQFETWKKGLSGALQQAGKQYSALDRGGQTSQGGFAPAPRAGQAAQQPMMPAQRAPMPTPQRSTANFGAGQVQASYGNSPQDDQSRRRLGGFRYFG